jgi:hypothetical protein
MSEEAREEARVSSRDNGRASFRINPANALGIDADATRSKLVAIALSKPESYYKLRDTAINAITRNLAVEIYDMYFDILTDGIIPNKDNEDENKQLGYANLGEGTYQLIYPDVDGTPYQGQPFRPNLPEKSVNIICARISDQIKSIARNIIEEILPINHLEMSQKKQTDIMKAKGI